MYPTLESRADILRMLDDMTHWRKRILEQCATLSEAQLQYVVDTIAAFYRKQ